MMKYIVYIWNRTPKKAIDMATPYEQRFGRKPDISDFHTFGSIVYVKREKELNKLDPQAQEGHWIGREEESNGHFIYWPTRKTVSTERNVTFSNRQIQPVEGEDGNLGNLETSVTESEQPVIPVPDEIAEPVSPDEVTGKWIR